MAHFLLKINNKDKFLSNFIYLSFFRLIKFFLQLTNVIGGIYFQSDCNFSVYYRSEGVQDISVRNRDTTCSYTLCKLISFIGVTTYSTLAFFKVCCRNNCRSCESFKKFIHFQYLHQLTLIRNVSLTVKQRLVLVKELRAD